LEKVLFVYVVAFVDRYGKTARGLAIDWETSVKEAQETVERW
jgi:hypothetical protein